MTKKSSRVSFMNWSIDDVFGVFRYHPIPCVLAVTMVIFRTVESTLFMIPPTSPPFDLGFIVTKSIHAWLSSNPVMNTVCAALNTVYVAMQAVYVLGTWLVEGRMEAAMATLIMFTCRGILGYATQLPLPVEFLGSGADVPLHNGSFFLFYSGHVAYALIASLDMRRMNRKGLAWTFEIFNVLQVVRLLGTRGHYTIDLAVGMIAGFQCDVLAVKYVEWKKRGSISPSSSFSFV